jgi:hypothetical protein
MAEPQQTIRVQEKYDPHKTVFFSFTDRNKEQGLIHTTQKTISFATKPHKVMR